MFRRPLVALCLVAAFTAPCLAARPAPPPLWPERPHHAGDGENAVPWWQALAPAKGPTTGAYDGLFPFVDMPPDTGIYSEISAAVDPSTGQHMVAGTNAFVARGNAWYTSNDFGRTWSFGYLPLTVNGTNYEWGADPAVACDRQGRFYYAYLAYNTTKAGTAVTVAHSDDHGHTWIPVAAVQSPSPNGYADDKEFVTVDNTDSPYAGTVYLAWDRVVTNPLRYVAVVSRSQDHGATWSTPAVLDARGSKQLIGCYPAVGPHGEVVITWHAYDRDEVQCVRSLDGGATWSAASVCAVTHCGYGHYLDNYPARAIGPSQATDIDRSAGGHRGRVYTVFVDSQGLADFDVFVTWSDDAGATWSTPVKVYADSAHSDQFLPACAVNDRDGAVTVGWYDRRNTGNTWADYYIARSLDGGATWEEQRVTQAPLNPWLCVDGFGDYTWLSTSAVTGRTTPWWSDTADAVHMNAATALADAPLLGIAGPDSASTVTAGVPLPVTWSLSDSAGVDSLALLLSTDAGRTFAWQATFAATAPRGRGAMVGSGTLLWTPPLVAADSCVLALEARNVLGVRSRLATRGTFALAVAVPAGDPGGARLWRVDARADGAGVTCALRGAAATTRVRYALLRADGRLLARGDLRGDATWRIAAPAAGLYFVRATADGAPPLTTRVVRCGR